MKQSIIQTIFFISSCILSTLFLDYIKINKQILTVSIYICIVAVYLVYTHISKKNKEKLKLN
ncbi:hypothetical protein [Clostridium estertheticum]|uniref:hypothetical protein n=1 Tax=Clostridium estertheticum TaxID=238834 RepID=UPI0027152BC2|nr:hypothetical protein [Clostridium estertheticum]WLC91037.1 hypothetical protein KTC95_23360 [Clostridium estertheticum]